MSSPDYSDKLEASTLPNRVDVSVVIPFYNSASTLARALDSVDSQSIRPREIIIVDDGSDARNSAWAMQVLKNYPLARIITLPQNAGPAEARNAGWAQASGKWIAFLDCDDAWHPRKLELQFHCIEMNPSVAMVAAKWVLSSDEVDFARSEIWPYATRRVTKTDLLIRNRMSTPSVLVKRDLKFRFPRGRRFCEDYELWLNIAASGEEIVRLEVPLVALFKAPYGASGQSAAVWRMIAGEYSAFLGAKKVGKLTNFDLAVGLSSLTTRTAVRLSRIMLRKLKHQLRSANRN